MAPGKRTLTESLAYGGSASAPLQMKSNAPATPGSASPELEAEEEAEGDRDNNDADPEAPAHAAAANESGGDGGGGGDAGGDEGGGEDSGDDDGGGDAQAEEEEEEAISDEEIQAEAMAAAGMAGGAEGAGAGAAPGQGGAPMQARAGGGGLHHDADLPASSGGAPMPVQLRSAMEHSFQTDFSSVQVHQDSPRAAALGALAYTEGNAVHMAPGQYDPGSQGGRELIGHELAHVVQQRDGRVSATGQAKGLPVNEDPALEQEADDLGRRAAGGEVVARSSGIQIRNQLGAMQMRRPVLQMARTHFGSFRPVTYHSLKAGKKFVGVEMVLRFRPNRLVNAKQIAMVQAVRSANVGAPVALTPTVGARSITAADSIAFPSTAMATDQGFHIDRLSTEASPLYGSMGTNPTQNLLRFFGVNPALSTSNAPTAVSKLNKAGRAAAAAATGLTGVTHAGKGQFGHRFRVGRRLHLKSAELRDTPNLPGRTTNAEQVFETTALATDGTQSGTYYGSVQWGWRSNAKGRFRRLPLKVISQGTPSSTFMKSAELWNAGSTSGGVRNMQLPVVDVHLINARTRMNPGIRGRPHTRLRRGTRVEILNRAEVQPDGRVLARIRVTDGSLTGREGLVDPARLTDERP